MFWPRYVISYTCIFSLLLSISKKIINKCNIKGCDSGLYGNECKAICGNCRDIDQCFYKNGTCLTGCADGYQGDLCITRE